MERDGVGLISRLSTRSRRSPLAIGILCVCFFSSALPLVGCQPGGALEDGERAVAAVAPTRPVIALEHPIGRLTSVRNDAVIELQSYDARGRTVHEQALVGAESYVSRTTYDSLDRPVQVMAPDLGGKREVITHVYGRGGAVTAVGSSLAGVVVAPIQRRADGRTARKRFGNGAVTTYAYDATTRRLRNISTARGATLLQSLDYFFDADGNLLGLNDNLRGLHACHPSLPYSPGNAATACAHDSLHRLTRAQAGTYAYDAVGNMTAMEGQPFVYGDPQHVHAVSSALGMSYVYDANGSLVSRSDGREVEWTPSRLPALVRDGGVTRARFTYGPDGSRLAKEENGVTTQYIAHAEIRNGDVTRYYFAGDERVAQLGRGGLSYNHQDHLQSSNVVTGAAGDIVKVTAFRPYGGLRSESGALALYHRFTDKELDDTGYYDYGARHYDPELGRFLTPDPLGVDEENPQSLNRYAYALNSPLVYHDPTGHFAWVPVLLAVASFAASFIPNRALRTVAMFAIGFAGGANWLTGAKDAISLGSRLLGGALAATTSNLPGTAGRIVGISLAFWNGYQNGWNTAHAFGYERGPGYLAGILEAAENAGVGFLPGYGPGIYGIAHAVVNDAQEDDKKKRKKEKTVGEVVVDKSVKGGVEAAEEPLEKASKSTEQQKAARRIRTTKGSVGESYSRMVEKEVRRRVQQARTGARWVKRAVKVIKVVDGVLITVDVYKWVKTGDPAYGRSAFQKAGGLIGASQGVKLGVFGIKGGPVGVIALGAAGAIGGGVGGYYLGGYIFDAGYSLYRWVRGK